MNLEAMKKIFNPLNVTGAVTTLAFAGAAAGLIVGAVVVGSTVATVALAVAAAVAIIFTLMSTIGFMMTKSLNENAKASDFFQMYRENDGMGLGMILKTTFELTALLFKKCFGIK